MAPECFQLQRTHFTVCKWQQLNASCLLWLWAILQFFPAHATSAVRGFCNNCHAHHASRHYHLQRNLVCWRGQSTRSASDMSYWYFWHLSLWRPEIQKVAVTSSQDLNWAKFHPPGSRSESRDTWKKPSWLGTKALGKVHFSASVDLQLVDQLRSVLIAGGT